MLTSRLFTLVLLATTAVWGGDLASPQLAQAKPETNPFLIRPSVPGTAPASTVVKPSTAQSVGQGRTPLFPPVNPPKTGADETSPASTDLSNTIPNSLTAEEIAQGWKLLFDGNRLIGMRGVQRSDPISSGWKIARGELTLPKENRQMDQLTGGDLATIEQFWDFEFRFEWRCTASANSGIRYLVNSALGQAPTGLEFQIIDDVHNPIGLKGGPLRRSGALDNVLPVGANAKLRSADPMARKSDPWNEGKIVVRGNNVEHWMNGERVLEFTLSPTLRTTADRNYNRDEPFAQRPHATYGTKARTPIVIADQGLEVSFRNLKVRALTPQAGTVARPTVPTVPGAPATPATPTAGAPAGSPNPFLIPPKR